jgi:regulatory protein
VAGRPFLIGYEPRLAGAGSSAYYGISRLTEAIPQDHSRLRTSSGAIKVDTQAIEAELLERWALHYLGRYASSAENLRRVLMRRVRRHSPDAVQPASPMIDALLARYREAGLLDDAAYAAGRVRSLQRRGESLRAMRARLAAKGVAAADIADALTELQAAAADPDLAAACAFARRRRLGPYRRSPDADHLRELAAFARAGFGRRVAEAVLACPDIEAAEALARDGLD